ncbi:NYN domain-containing protein [Streptomyces sp. JJ36]|uniref:NYN domain-containing protein n=1 Tax=Streptomyces sp. JJ36 TaxID=2736645 RepID=UPI001F39748D|nr:NYN domain-containing protein [Streptomyces sp. JJ36]MCF6522972.1 NYN domain-containing protein [Streptomyces sp. JJ36]
MADSANGDRATERGTPDEALDRPLPEKVRRRVVTLAGEALGGLTMAELPLPLRQYARFTPQRRAKFGGNAIAAALENDAVFRQRIAGRLRETLPELAEALESGSPPPAADPVEVAAVAYVLRPDGWPKLVLAAGEEAARAQAERAGEETQRELTALREELARTRSAARDEAERARADQEAARKELEAVQRRLRSAQSDVKRGEAALRKLRAELESVRDSAATEKAAADKDVRRLRTRLAEAESALEAGRRAAREGRSLEDMRVRLLLDTVLDAAQGLRRELAVPPSEVRPADTVEAVEPGRMSPKDLAARGLSETDPARLDQLLSLPQTHLVVDGYNVTKTGYPTLPLEKQRLRLLGGLAGLAAQSGAEVTCVFDGAELAAPVLLAPPRGVRVLFSKPGQTADELIRQLVRAEPAGRPVVVVSSDREVADGCAAAGARPVASALLLKRLARS